MAAVAVDRAMNFDNGSNHLHPFFAQNKRHEVVHQAIATNDAEEQPSTTDNEAEVKEGPKKRSKRSQKQEVNGQRTILQGFGIKSEVNSGPSKPVENEDEDLQAPLEADPNHERRKRRKTASPGRDQVTRAEEHLPATIIPDSDEGFADLAWRHQLEAEAGVAVLGKDARLESSTMPTEDAAVEDQGAAPSTPEVISGGDVVQIIPTKPVTDDTRPTRTMRLKGGKLASPTAAKNASPKTPRRGGRGKAAATDAFIVKIDYGTRSPNAKEMGRRIQSILDGEPVHGIPVLAKSVTEKVMTTAASRPKTTDPPKATHPFFTGKAKKSDFQNGPASPIKSISQHVDLTKPSPRKASTTTPGKLRTQRDAFRMPGPAAPNFGVPAERKKPKYAGEHPAWPTQDNIHVRGLEADSGPALPEDPRSAGFVQKSSKRKVVSADPGTADDSLAVLAEDVHDGEGHLRHPTKLVTTGAGLQDLAMQRLSNGALDRNAHPALHSMYQGIRNELSAFDKYECETKSWTHKYAPKAAVEVLQAGREALVLKDWLQRSTITAVQTSSKRSTVSSTTSNVKTKKKRKRKDEDDFIVDSDDEIDELNELLPLSDAHRPSSALKSVVRGGDQYEQSTPASTVLLSGPYGSGKSAAVYAVAKELGFEIFEINSASRRSGKDVIDKIGDMTENHLVQQVSKALTEEGPADDNGKIEAIKIDQPDAPDPKQKSMASFFKAGPATKKVATGSTNMQKAIAKAKDETKPKSRQKQSLILFEEVDELFEEDKQFWLTVLTIAAHSKRPIVMTCNDERYVPEAFTFHAILRFVSPPVDLATDHLLLMAAREGHVLERSSVESLYKTKGSDLRGSITELNFWCQMAVGDPTRGFLWMLDRYPPGVDLDDQGRTLRTASQDTFVSGMNVVSQDLCSSSVSKRCAGAGLWLQAWDDWQVEVSNHNHTSHSAELESLSLDDYAFALDVLSAGDMSFGFCMRPANDQPQDPSTPPLRERVVACHALGLSGRPDLLQSELLHDYTCLDKELAIASHVMTMNLLRGGQEDQAESSSSQRSAQDDIINTVTRRSSAIDQSLTRNDFSQAFDVLAADPDDQFTSSTTVTASSFDREFTVIAKDLAPYIRAISHEFQRREEEHLRTSNLLSAGGRRRQTRNAFAAMDGGRRSDRRARYFETWRKLGVVVGDVLRTGGDGWSVPYGGDGFETRTGTASGLEEAEGNLISTQETDELH